MNLKEELARVKEELALAQNLWKQSPDYIEAVANVNIIATREQQKYEPEVEKAEKKYNDLYALLLESRDQPELPEDIISFFKRIRLGVDWGPVDFRMRWRSENKRFFILTIPGAQYWGGRGTAYYGNTHHHLIDLDAYNWHNLLDSNQLKGGSDMLRSCEVIECKGRLSKAIQEAWITKAEELSKKVYAPSKDPYN